MNNNNQPIKENDDYMYQTPIDPRTDFGKGLEPKIDPQTDFGKELEPKIDPRTDFGKGLEPKIDPRTDFGKGITFKSVDGKDWATYEEAMAYNKLYYDSLMIKSSQDLEKTSGRQR